MIKNSNLTPFQRETSFVSDVLNSIKVKIDKGSSTTEELQLEIEKLCLNEFDISKQFVHEVNTSYLNNVVSTFVIQRIPLLDKYLDNLKKSLSNSSKENNIMIHLILNKLEDKVIRDILIHWFLLILTYLNTDIKREDNIYLLSSTIRIGKKVVRSYFRDLFKDEVSKDNNFSYSNWLENWKISNEKDSSLLIDNDEFYAEIGAKCFDILYSAGFLDKVLIKDKIKRENHYEITISDEKLLKSVNNLTPFCVPTKLPMIIPPKPYGPNKLGGYLLNDLEYKESLFITKKSYKISSSVTEDNVIYDMVNKISSVPFKINIPLLEYLILDTKHNLLLSPHKNPINLEECNYKTQKRLSQFRSYNSKVVLQELIIEIAIFYQNFNELYFPVRLDQRGRLYCNPSFFHYQSSELAKALLLFSKPGIICRKDMESIAYLKAFGAINYGGSISKKSLVKKVEWVDNNIDNIINFDNGILLKDAEDKYLFLAFCLEFKRFYEFYIDEDKLEFQTYLPIQLDATCNGFQHLALLSNEQKLFKELNLSKSDPTQDPKDFYNFLLFSLILKFTEKVALKEFIDVKTSGNYQNLLSFGWDRRNIKKTIMTIPYNATHRSMKKYFVDSLKMKCYDEVNKTYIYEDAQGNTINDRDANLLIDCIKEIIFNDFEKIKKLIKYLNNVATLYKATDLPITWRLPSGLIIYQSYLLSKSKSISPFTYSKVRLNLKVTLDSYDQAKQTRAFMPNLIHSLDATSLTLLFIQFNKQYPNTQFYSVHDCFGTTCDKVFVLKTMLASVYTNLYSNDQYLLDFDNDLLNYFENITSYNVDRVNRSITLSNEQEYFLHDINWVLNKKTVGKAKINAIEQQYILL